MAEKEYIEREAAIEKLNKLCDRVCQYSKAQRKYMCGACPLGDAFTVIEDDIPAADVRPVVRARIVDMRYVEDDGEWKCTHCGWQYTLCVCGKDVTSKIHFCPNCGCAMEGTE